MLVAVAALTLGGCRHEELPRLFPVPAKQLVNDAGQPMSLSSLNGKVAIYDFIFTRCGGTCPLVTRHMQSLIADLPKSDDLRFVSVSVDPTNDTPAVLRSYAAKVRHDDRWMFLTGDPAEIRDLSVNGFKLAAGEATASTTEPILHSTKFVLVDKNGVVRNYYDSSDRASLKRLVDDAEDLLD